MDFSFSSIGMFRKCPRQYEFRYVKGIKIPPGGSLIRGIGVHSGLEFDMQNKIDYKTNLETNKVLEIYSDAFDREVDRYGRAEIDWKKEKPGKCKDGGIDMLKVYHPTEAVKLSPKYVEQKFELALEGEDKLIGRIDLIETDHVLIDWKTATRKKASHHLYVDQQPIFYQMAFPQASELRMDVLLHYKTKKDDVQVLKRKPATKRELDLAREDIYDVIDSIKSGANYRCNPDNWWCSADWCGYWSLCRGKRR